MDGRWYITERAAREYCQLRGWRENADDLERATDELIAIGRAAHLVRVQDNGLELWRAKGSGRTTPRYRLLVGDPPKGRGEIKALVRVLPERAG